MRGPTRRRAGRQLPVTRVGRVRSALTGPVVTRRVRPALVGLAVLVVSLVGVVVGLLLGSRTITELGPFHAELAVTPSLVGDTSVFIPPLGSLHLDSHDGPAHLSVRLGALDQIRTERILNEPGGITRVSRTVADEIRGGVIRVGAGSLGAAVLGAMLLSALVFRNVRRVAWSGGLSLAVVAGSLGVAATTFRYDAVEEPRYEGLLVNAPMLIGDVQRIADRYEEYAAQLQRMVVNVSLLYTNISTLDALGPNQSTTRVLHVSDLHLNPAAWRVIRTVVEQYDIDLVIDSGDIVDWGTGPESTYLDAISDVEVPYVYVRGNHDSPLTADAVAAHANAIVLDDEVETVEGLTVAGIRDPEFTPDQRTAPHTEDAAAGAATRPELLLRAGARLAGTIRRHGEPVDIAIVHDPAAAEPLDGLVPMVLAGHTHNRVVRPLVPPEDEDAAADPAATRLMVQGSTGGAGLRGLEGDIPEPLALSVLHFDVDQRLIGYDDITVGGTGQSEVMLDRTVVEHPEPADNAPLDGTPTPSPTG